MALKPVLKDRLVAALVSLQEVCQFGLALPDPGVDSSFLSAMSYRCLHCLPNAMNKPNLDQLSTDWQALFDSATVDHRPADRFGMVGIWAEEDGWHFRPTHDTEVRVPDIAALERLGAGLPCATVVGTHEVYRAIVLSIGEAKLEGREPDWTKTRNEIKVRLNQGIAVVAIGGIRSSEIDADEFAAPLRLGEHVVAGHLDPSLDAAAADLARRHGLPGYRFSDDSWWTEDFLSAKEDHQVGQELMDDVIAADSWPWLVLLVAAPASGAASEVAVIATAQALLGALVLLDQQPSAGWAGAAPWIAGGLGPAAEPRCPGDESRDWTLPIAPQHVDALTRHLDNAESELGTGAPARVIDLARHAHGPAGKLLQSVVDSSLCVNGLGEGLAKGCRLAWLASATETASSRWTLARSAYSEFLHSTGGNDDLLALASAGVVWRREHDENWPEGNPYGPDADLAAWERGLVSEVDAAGLPSPSWGESASRRAQMALDLAQACFFGLAVA
jgi:hypothetical protein